MEWKTADRSAPAGGPSRTICSIWSILYLQPLLSKLLPLIGGSRGSLTAFAPDQAPIDHLVDVAELADRRIERVAGDGQRFIRAPEQLCSNILVINLQREFTIEQIAVSNAPIRTPSPDGVTS